MNQILTIASVELKNILREKIFFLLLAVFIGMIAVASFIGWSTYTTTSSVYQESVIYMKSIGVNQLPPNPISSFSALASFRNVIVYIFLIGSLASVVIGNHSFIRERKAGTLPLIYTRPLSVTQLLAGKIIGISIALLLVLSITSIISIVTSYILPLQHLTSSDIVRLLMFYGYSFFYILLFSLVGAYFAISAKSESLALFIPVCIWVGVSFVMPELITGQTPTALLNPVTIDQLVNKGGFFSLMQQYLSPVAVGWHFTNIGSQLLNSRPDNLTGMSIIQSNNISITVLLSFMTITYLFMYSGLQHIDIANDHVEE